MRERQQTAASGRHAADSLMLPMPHVPPTLPQVLKAVKAQAGLLFAQSWPAAGTKHPPSASGAEGSSSPQVAPLCQGNLAWRA